MVSAVKKENVAVRGRGILDMSDLPWHSRRTLWFLDSRNILVEGITMLNSATWTIVAGNCENVTIRNVKQIASEDTSSDGVDLLHCRDVVVEDCFMRNDDDAICVKTPWGGEPARNILVQRCVIWNERARGLGLISETRRDIENVTFRDCDIIHDFSDGHDCAALGILVSDARHDEKHRIRGYPHRGFDEYPSSTAGSAPTSGVRTTGADTSATPYSATSAISGTTRRKSGCPASAPTTRSATSRSRIWFSAAEKSRRRKNCRSKRTNSSKDCSSNKRLRRFGVQARPGVISSVGISIFRGGLFRSDRRSSISSQIRSVSRA